MGSTSAFRTPSGSDSIGFQRARSRVFYESEYSSPTSWEFRGISTSNSHTIPEDSEIGHFYSPLSSSTPMSTRNSVSRISTGKNSGLRADGSRNSSGSSSSDSHRSHDSGFLDSIETQKVRSGQNNRSGSHSSNSSSERKSERHYSSMSPNHASPTELKSMPKDSNCTHAQSQSCSSCIYQEIIVASSQGGTISPIPDPSSVPGHVGGPDHFGTPACSSTPKKSFSNLKRVSAMQKIDNFESLNKNIKALDTNNNKSPNNSMIPLSSKPINVEALPDRVRDPSLSTIVQNPISNVKSYSLSNVPRVLPRYPWRQSSGPQIRPFTTSSPNRDGLKSNLKYQPLPRGFKRIPASPGSSATEDKIIKSHFDNDAVRLWLHELRFEAEPESLISLQVKSLCGEDRTPDLPPSDSLSAILISIRHIERVASFVSEEYAIICKQLEGTSFGTIPTLVLDLLVFIEDFLKDIQEIYGKLDKMETNLAHSCYELRLAIIALGDGPKERDFRIALENMELKLDSPTESRKGIDYFQPRPKRRETMRCYYSEKREILMAEIVEGIVGVGNLFSKVVDQRIRRDLCSILDLIGAGGLGGRVALQLFTRILYDGGTEICKLASSIRTVRAILSAMLDSEDELDRVLCLRCLATVLCVGEAVTAFDKAGGFEIIADILYDPDGGFQLKFEAVAVLTQATDPWIDLESTLSCLRIHLEKIIFSLTKLIPYCQYDEDWFLLTMAAISNLTFLELSSIEYLRFFETISFITAALGMKSDFSVFVMDHISTIFANMAGIDSCRQDIIRIGGVHLLIQFLETSPLQMSSQTEVTACERLQQKSTIALSRLSNETGVAQTVLKLGGIHRLVQLSMQDQERNYSDGVLIASLATLRKLVSICGSEVIKELRAEELIEPRLLDSFLLFSSRQESYV